MLPPDGGMLEVNILFYDLLFPIFNISEIEGNKYPNLNYKDVLISHLG